MSDAEAAKVEQEAVKVEEEAAKVSASGQGAEKLETPVSTPAPANDDLEVIMEGWGGKQGTKYPNWNIRWFVLEKRKSAVVADSDEVKDTRDYFVHSSDSFERAHNYNVSNDKKSLILSYYVDETKKELKECFVFDENTYWKVAKPRVTCPKYNGGPIEAIYLFCKGSRGSKKLVFTPFWGFVEPTFNLLCQPWVLTFEFGTRGAYDRDGNNYYGGLATVDEDTFGKTTKDLQDKLAKFKGCFVDDVTFKPYKENPMAAAKLFLPIAVMGKNGQDDNPSADDELMNAAKDTQTQWQMKFNKKMKELNAQKESVGGRDPWLKLNAQARHRHITFDSWMAIKDHDNNMETIPAHLR